MFHAILATEKLSAFYRTEQNPTWDDSDKYSYVKPTTSEEIRALLGIMFIRGVMMQILRHI